MLKLEVPDLELSVRMDLNEAGNPELCKAIRAMLPLKSLFGHVVISGDGMWLPTRLVYLGAPQMVKRALGSVYFNAPGQTICITYGAITESAVVNEFAHVREADFGDLRAIGEAVWRRTVTDPVRRGLLGIISECGE